VHVVKYLLPVLLLRDEVNTLTYDRRTPRDLLQRHGDSSEQLRELLDAAGVRHSSVGEVDEEEEDMDCEEDEEEEDSDENSNNAIGK